MFRSKFIDGSDATEYQRQIAPLIHAVADAVTEEEEVTMPETIYQKHGYSSRDDYRRCMSEEYGVPLRTVHALAELLGPSEDFDGLVTALADYEGASDNGPRPERQHEPLRD